jgi:hypothetical protein
MRRLVKVVLEVEHDDGAADVDVSEAVRDAVKSLSAMAFMLPKLKGKSARGRTVEFKVRSAQIDEA